MNFQPLMFMGQIQAFEKEGTGHVLTRLWDGGIRELVLGDLILSVGDVRGLGLFVGLELVKNKKTKEPMTAVNSKLSKGSNPKLEVAKKLGEMGMMAMAANPVNVIAMAPALIVTKSEIDEGVAIMDKALEVADAYVD